MRQKYSDNDELSSSSFTTTPHYTIFCQLLSPVVITMPMKQVNTTLCKQ